MAFQLTDRGRMYLESAPIPESEWEPQPPGVAVMKSIKEDYLSGMLEVKAIKGLVLRTLRNLFEVGYIEEIE